ncbi:hypothetical protein DM02DRAFT_134497 [Periconia macrospinosa]|uniref:Uncharacterized protein n=1 Tax=Periconia macrospinosa TaxID=97972 RepID=A0A2V1E5K9_9PLEO|nr:hypothetical protein DM02DRAFT_134497 [Periconia macrospinosa]
MYLYISSRAYRQPRADLWPDHGDMLLCWPLLFCFVNTLNIYSAIPCPHSPLLAFCSLAPKPVPELFKRTALRLRDEMSEVVDVVPCQSNSRGGPKLQPFDASCTYALYLNVRTSPCIAPEPRFRCRGAVQAEKKIKKRKKIRKHGHAIPTIHDPRFCGKKISAPPLPPRLELESKPCFLHPLQKATIPRSGLQSSSLSSSQPISNVER